MTGVEPDQADQFVRLLTLNERRVSAYILSLVPNWADADEIHQETNVRLWKEFPKYVPGTDFGAWACTVAWFQVRTFLKKRSRQRVVFTDEFIEVVSNQMNAEDDTAARHQALERCIGALSATHQAMLRAYYRPGALGAEVAAQFKRSTEALYKALSRIRKTLHECVERQLKAEVGP